MLGIDYYRDMPIESKMDPIPQQQSQGYIQHAQAPQSHQFKPTHHQMPLEFAARRPGQPNMYGMVGQNNMYRASARHKQSATQR